MQEATYRELQDVAARFEAVAAKVRADGETALKSGDHVEVIKHFKALRDVNAIVKTSRAALQELEEAFSRHHIPEIFSAVRERTGQKPPFVIEGIGRVNVSHKYSCTIIAPKPEGHQWLKDNGYGELVTETVNSSTLAAFAKDLLENKGEELPDDIFKTSLNPYTSITKV